MNQKEKEPAEPQFLAPLAPCYGTSLQCSTMAELEQPGATPNSPLDIYLVETTSRVFMYLKQYSQILSFSLPYYSRLQLQLLYLLFTPISIFHLCRRSMHVCFEVCLVDTMPHVCVLTSHIILIQIFLYSYLLVIKFSYQLILYTFEPHSYFPLPLRLRVCSMRV